LGPNEKLPASVDGLVKCPEATPFWNGTACIQCSGATNLFSNVTKKCVACNETTEKFNSTTHQCDKINNDYLTAKNASNLVNGDWPTTYWNQTYDNLKK